MVYYVEKVRHDLTMIPFGCPIWFRTTNDWCFWRKARTKNAHRLKKVVNAHFKQILDECRFPPAYPAVLVSQHHLYNLHNGEVIANYFSATFWGAMSLGRDFSSDEYLNFFAHRMLDLILRRCNQEIVADPAYNLYYGPPTPGTWGVPSIVTRKRTIFEMHSDNL
jgi:hypothetical protein